MLDDVLKLPQSLDVAALRAVQKDLLDRRGKATTIDASDVERIGGLGVELLIAARRQWLEDAVVLQIIGVPDAMKEAFIDLGLDVATLDVRETDMEQGKL